MPNIILSDIKFNPRGKQHYYPQFTVEETKGQTDDMACTITADS